MSKLTVIRTKRDKNYSSINLTSLHDDRLSWRAKGLHAYFISRPNGWEIWKKDLLNKATDRTTSLNSAIKELIKFGYLVINQERKEDGTFNNTTYSALETPIPQDNPQAGKPFTGKPFTGKPLAGNQPYSNNEYSNNKKDSNNEKYKQSTVRIFDRWKSLDIKGHSKITDNIDFVIQKALSFHSEKEIIGAIDNYYQIVKSPNYFFNFEWNLQEFLQRGISIQGQRGNKGYLQFLTENNPFERFSNVKSEIERLRLEFKPISKKYSFGNIFDTERQTYYGFDVDKLRNQPLMWEYEEDVRENYNNSTFKWGYFCFLEELIASIFLNRKSGYDMELLKALMSIWRETKPDYKKTALELR